MATVERNGIQPTDSLVTIGVGDPLITAVDAVYAYFGDIDLHERHVGRLEELARTARAHVGFRFFGDGAERMRQFGGPPDADASLELTIRQLRDDHSATRVSAWNLIDEQINRIMVWAHNQADKAAAWELRRALSTPSHWNEVLAIAGKRGKGLHKAVIAHWRRVYAVLGGLVREGSATAGADWWLLRPQERAHLESLARVQPRQAAAYFTWDRAGRPGTFTTFIQRMGNRITAEDARAIDTGRPLTEMYRVGEDGSSD